jgi:LAO/AO transport system kinase
MVDFFLVLMLAGAGDELQGIKKGILEMADAIAITKADGDNVENANKAKRSYESALGLLHPASPTWFPPVVTCSALTATGVDPIWRTILDHNKKLRKAGELAEKRRHQALDWMWSLVEEGLMDRFKHHRILQEILTKITREVETGVTAPTDAAFALLSLFDDTE